MARMVRRPTRRRLVRDRETEESGSRESEGFIPLSAAERRILVERPFSCEVMVKHAHAGNTFTRDQQWTDGFTTNSWSRKVTSFDNDDNDEPE